MAQKGITMFRIPTELESFAWNDFSSSTRHKIYGSDVKIDIQVDKLKTDIRESQENRLPKIKGKDRGTY